MSKRTTRSSTAAAAEGDGHEGPSKIEANPGNAPLSGPIRPLPPPHPLRTALPAPLTPPLAAASHDKQKLLLSTDAGHFSLVRALHLADFITELNGACGALSIFSSLRYCLGPAADTANLWWALGLLPLGLFFDFMDGKVARWRKKSSLMGQELDSLADLVRLPAFLFPPTPPENAD